MLKKKPLKILQTQNPEIFSRTKQKNEQEMQLLSYSLPKASLNLIKFPVLTPLTTPSKSPLLYKTHISKSSFFSLSLSTKLPQSLIKPYYVKPQTQIQSLFTGIVEEMGKIKQIGQVGDNFIMKLSAKTVLEGVNLGDSIAVDGTCLTVTEFDTQLSEFTVGLAPETLRKTSLIELQPGSSVNLERAVQPTSRMGGHFVQGHVDGTGEIVGKEVEGDSLWVKVRTKRELLKYIVPKGYITVDGTSLTVVDVFDDEECFNFMLVAYTQQKVVIPMKKVGQKVNLEVDILGKYVERLLSNGFIESIKSSS